MGLLARLAEHPGNCGHIIRLPHLWGHLARCVRRGTAFHGADTPHTEASAAGALDLAYRLIERPARLPGGRALVYRDAARAAARGGLLTAAFAAARHGSVDSAVAALHFLHCVLGTGAGDVHAYLLDLGLVPLLWHFIGAGDQAYSQSNLTDGSTPPAPLWPDEGLAERSDEARMLANMAHSIMGDLYGHHVPVSRAAAAGTVPLMRLLAGGVEEYGAWEGRTPRGFAKRSDSGESGSDDDFGPPVGGLPGGIGSGPSGPGPLKGGGGGGGKGGKGGPGGSGGGPKTPAKV